MRGFCGTPDVNVVALAALFRQEVQLGDVLEGRDTRYC
jgi:hypothetical protein